MNDEDQFTPACVAAFKIGLEEAERRGKHVKALVICNPHNPLGMYLDSRSGNSITGKVAKQDLNANFISKGQCYPSGTLIQLLSFCMWNGIHLISDEIYALSTCPRSDRESEKFTSVLSVDFGGIAADPQLVHVLYGMSKVRCGCQLINAIIAALQVKAGLRCRRSPPGMPYYT